MMPRQEVISDHLFNGGLCRGMGSDLFSILNAPLHKNRDNGDPFQPTRRVGDLIQPLAIKLAFGKKFDPLKIGCPKLKPMHHFQKKPLVGYLQAKPAGLFFI